VIHVRAVDLDVTQRAGLVLRSLVVEGRDTGRISKGRGVTRQAKLIDIARLEHVRIRRAVRRMAGLAAFHLDRLMLVDKWPALIGVAGKAHRVLGGRGADLLGLDCAVRIVAVAALHKPLVHAVVKRHFECGFLGQMAAVTKLGLRLGQ